MSTGQKIGRAIGIVLYLVVGFFYLVSGLVVPVFPWLIILNIIWVTGLVYVLRISQERWWTALLAAPVAVVVWVAYVNGGAALLGWTA